MATTLYLRGSMCHVLTGNISNTNTWMSMKDAGRGVTPGAALFEGTGLDTSSARGLSTTIGSANANAGAGIGTTNTVTGPTAGIFMPGSNGPAAFLSAPVDADFTLSGTVTFNFCASESSMSANVTLRVAIYRMDSQGALTLILNSILGTELGTTNARNTWTGSPTSTAMKKGDRLMVLVMITDATATTMASGFTANVQQDGSAANLADTNIQLTETVGFLTSDPTGTSYWLRSTAGDINPGAITSKALSQTQGAGSATAVRATAAGALAYPGNQWTATSGGTAIEWYSPQLLGFTLGGLAQIDLGHITSTVIERPDISPFDVITCEIAVVDTDGSNAVVWARSYGSSNASGASVYTRYMSGADLTVNTGQRLRFRMFIDDARPNGNQASGTDRTIGYDGTGLNASRVRFTQTITEAPTVFAFPFSPAAQRRIVPLI